MFFFYRDRVHIGGIELDGNVHACLASAARKGVKQAGTLARAFLVNDFVKSFNPL
jgi:hypothetical protein